MTASPHRFALVEAIAGVVRHFPLTRAMAGRDFKGQYRGSLLGLGWVVLRPLAHAAIFTVIVVFVFGARMGPDSGPFDYPIYFLSGLAAWQFQVRAMEDGPQLVRDRLDLLRQVVFPIETLPLQAILVNGVGPLATLGVCLLVAGVAGKLAWTALLLPLPLLLMGFLMIGISWILMIIGVVVRDLRDFLSLLMTFGIYLSPTAVAETMVSPKIWFLLLLNPMAHPVIAFRDILFGTFHPWSWGVFVGMALGALLLGSIALRKLRFILHEFI